MFQSSVIFLSLLCHLSFFVFELACFCVTNCGGCVTCYVVSVGLCLCFGCVCVCMYVSVGYVCERLQVCWCATHTLNTRHTHHTHPHGRKGCVMCCIVQRCGKQQQTHNTTTHHHHHHHHHHHKHITTQHDTHHTATA